MLHRIHPVLRFPEENIQEISLRYRDATEDAKLLAVGPVIRARGCLTLSDLIQVAKWKSPRSAGLVMKNTDEYVREVTLSALNSKTERSRIEILTVLDGVHWPVASVILHFFHSDGYPILDFRALWSLSLEVPNQYGYGFWVEYVEFCRDLALRNSVDMRTLDKALWQYSKEMQPQG